MMKIFFLLFVLLPIITFSQRNIFFVDSFKIKTSFHDQVDKGMNKHHRSYKGNDFYKLNVNPNPLVNTDDSISFSLKFILSGGVMGMDNNLWGADGIFYNHNGYLVCLVKNLVLLKRSSTKGVNYINVSANEMEDTKGNRINLFLLEDEIKSFLKKFK